MLGECAFFDTKTNDWTIRSTPLPLFTLSLITFLSGKLRRVLLLGLWVSLRLQDRLIYRCFTGVFMLQRNWDGHMQLLD